MHLHMSLALPTPTFYMQDSLSKMALPGCLAGMVDGGTGGGREEWSHLSGAPGGELATYGCDGWRFRSAIC